MYKWIRFDYKAKRWRYFSKDNHYSREFFNNWDWRNKREGDAKLSKAHIQNILGVMIYEEKKRETVKNRSAEEKCALWTLRLSLISLSLLLLVVGFVVIILASIYENEITEAAKDIPILSSASQYAAAISLTIVNYIVPK